MTSQRQLRTIGCIAQAVPQDQQKRERRQKDVSGSSWDVKDNVQESQHDDHQASMSNKKHTITSHSVDLNLSKFRRKKKNQSSLYCPVTQFWDSYRKCIRCWNFPL